MKQLNWFSAAVITVLLTAASLLVIGCGGDSGTGPKPEPEKEVVYLDVRAIPPANILINGKGSGKITPAIIPVPVQGTCTIGVLRPGWDGWERVVTLPSIGDTLTVMFQPLKASIIGGISNEQGQPVKAQVLIEVFKNTGWVLAGVIENSDEDGSFTLKLPPGQYRVTAQPQGYVPVTAELDIGEDGVITGLMNFTLKPLPSTGTLDISSVPPGALVLVNGEEKGLTPLTLPDLAPGVYMVQLTLEGYEEVSQNFFIVAGKTTSWYPMLIRKPKPIDLFPNGREWVIAATFMLIPEKYTIKLEGHQLRVISWMGTQYGTMDDEGNVSFKMGDWLCVGKFYPETMTMAGGTDEPEHTWHAYLAD